MKKITMLLMPILIAGIMLASMGGVMALDANTPYTANMNFIVEDDTSFTVSLAGAETEIDFNPTSKDSKEVEPDSQNASESTPILTVTNTGNVELTFTHKVNDTMPTFAEVSFDIDNTVDWAKTITDSYSTINTSISADGTVKVYMWANFTDADSGTATRVYQINSTVA